jgi:hypothetical protein
MVLNKEKAVSRVKLRVNSDHLGVYGSFWVLWAKTRRITAHFIRCDPLQGCLTTLKPCRFLRHLQVFLFFISSPRQAWLGLKNKTPALSRQGLRVVDKRFEISNLSLIKNIFEIIEFGKNISGIE